MYAFIKSGHTVRWALQIQSYYPKILYNPGKSIAVANLLFRATYDDFVRNLNVVFIDLASRKYKDIFDEQIKYENVKKITDCFKSAVINENYINWTNSGCQKGTPKDIAK